MQKTQQGPNVAGDSGFTPIPTRIREVPPLIVEKENAAVSEEVTTRLGELGVRLATIHRAAAEAYLSQAMYEQALPHARAAATFDPSSTEYTNQLGYILYIQGEDAEAIECFERVLASEPGQPDALFNLGMVLFGREDFATAEECFRRSLEAHADDAETWNNRGVCLHQLGRTIDARTCFERALQIDPDNQDAQANLGSIAG